MMLDIAAMQQMYGADFTTNAGNTVYSWPPGSGRTLVDGQVGIDPGGNRIFATVWDGGGQRHLRPLGLPDRRARRPAAGRASIFTRASSPTSAAARTAATRTATSSTRCSTTTTRAR